MGVVAAARKHTSLQTQIIKLLPDAAEVQTAHQAVAPVLNLHQQKIIINFSAIMDYLRLYQMPDEARSREAAASAIPPPQGSIQCVCCGQVARVDAVGFCDACMTAAAVVVSA